MITEAVSIIGKLIAGNTYTLEEINVPTGYVAADPLASSRS
ncbi:MAG: hypothetical protein ACLU6Y_06510 [Ruminococcus sp.]